MKPICVKCKTFYRMKKSGFYFEEGMPGPGAAKREDVPSGTLPGWTSYKLWVGDLWECRGCGHQLLSGFGQGPISEHYKPDYQQQRAAFGVTLRIDDC